MQKGRDGNDRNVEGISSEVEGLENQLRSLRDLLKEKAAARRKEREVIADEEAKSTFQFSPSAEETARFSGESRDGSQCVYCFFLLLCTTQ